MNDIIKTKRVYTTEERRAYAYYSQLGDDVAAARAKMQSSEATCAHNITVTVIEDATEQFGLFALDGASRTDRVDCGKILGWV
jgi:hypothetical protein